MMNKSESIRRITMKIKSFYFLTRVISGFLGSVVLVANACEDREPLLQGYQSGPATCAAATGPVQAVEVSFFYLGEGEAKLHRYCIALQRSLDLREVRKRLIRYIGREVPFAGAASSFFNIPEHLCPDLYRDYSRYDLTIKGHKELLTELRDHILHRFPPDPATITSFLVSRSDCHRGLAASSSIPFAIVMSVTPRVGEDEKSFYARLRAEGRNRANKDALLRTLSEGFYTDLRRYTDNVRRIREAAAAIEALDLDAHLVALVATSSPTEATGRAADRSAASGVGGVVIPVVDGEIYIPGEKRGVRASASHQGTGTIPVVREKMYVPGAGSSLTANTLRQRCGDGYRVVVE